MLMGGVENGSQAPCFFVGVLCRFAETTLKPLISIQTFICEPQTRTNLGETAGRSRTGSGASGTRTGRVWGNREGGRVFSLLSGESQAAALGGRGLFGCWTSPLKNKNQTNDGVYHKRVRLKIHPFLDPSAASPLSPLIAVYCRPQKARLSLFAPKQPEKERKKTTNQNKHHDPGTGSAREAVGGPSAGHVLTSQKRVGDGAIGLAGPEGGVGHAPLIGLAGELPLRAPVSRGDRGSAVGSGLGRVAPHFVACE